MPTRHALWAGGNPTNSLSSLSVVLGLLWLGGIGSVLAVICGHRARRQIAEHWQRGYGRAAFGVRLGWIGIVVTGLLAVLVVFSPEQLGHQWDQIERAFHHLVDDRSPFG